MDTTEWIKELCPEIADWQVELIAGEYQALREANEEFAKRQEWWDRKMFQLEQQLEEAVLAEREACARVCEAIRRDLLAGAEYYAAGKCIDAIRARGGDA